MARTTNRLALFLLIAPLFATAAFAGLPRAVGPVDPSRFPPVTGSAVSGLVASVQGNIITLSTGGATPIMIDASVARFVGDLRTASIADAKTGAHITAFVTSSTETKTGAALSAQLITIDSTPDLRITGALQSIDAERSSFSILGIILSVDANTSYSSALPTFAPIRGLGDLAVGQVVDVTGVFGNGKIVASRVQLLAFSLPSATVIRGNVKSISSTAWVLTGSDAKDVTVIVNAQTKIIGSPKAGDLVQVSATIDSAHNYVAVVIMKQ